MRFLIRLYFYIFYIYIQNKESQEIQEIILPSNPIEELINYFKNKKKLTTIITGNELFDTKISNAKEINFSVLVTNDKSIYGINFFNNMTQKIFHLFLDIKWDLDFMKRQIYLSKSPNPHTSHFYSFFAVDSILNCEILNGVYIYCYYIYIQINMEMCSLGSRKVDTNILSLNKDYLFEDTTIIIKNILEIKYFIEKDFSFSKSYNNSNLFKLCNGLLNEGKFEINYFFQHLKTMRMEYQNIILQLLSDVEIRSERKSAIKFLPCVEDIELDNYKNLIINSFNLTFHNQKVKSIQFEIKNTVSWNDICKIKQLKGGEYYY